MPKTLAAAAVDRLLHHTHVVVTEGESFRSPKRRAERGCCPSINALRSFVAAYARFAWPPARTFAGRRCAVPNGH